MKSVQKTRVENRLPLFTIINQNSYSKLVFFFFSSFLYTRFSSLVISYLDWFDTFPTGSHFRRNDIYMHHAHSYFSIMFGRSYMKFRRYKTAMMQGVSLDWLAGNWNFQLTGTFQIFLVVIDENEPYRESSTVLIKAHTRWVFSPIYLRHFSFTGYRFHCCRTMFELSSRGFRMGQTQ